MPLRDLVKFFLRFFRNISLKIPFIYNIFLKLEYKRRSNIEFFSSQKRSINTSILYAQNRFSIYLELLRKYNRNYDFHGKKVLVIGPGDNLLIGFIFLLNGAKELYLIDKFSKPLDDSYEFILLKNYLKRKSSTSYIETSEKIKLLKNRINYFPNTPFEKFNKLNRNSIDLIVSSAVLEHLNDLELAIKVMKYLLKEGGLSVHRIDLRDHLHLKDNCFLDFLKYSPRFWKLFGDLTNRIRCSQYITFFKKYNFDIIFTKKNKIRTISKIDEIKNAFYHNYKILTKEDLSIISFDLVAKNLV